MGTLLHQLPQGVVSCSVNGKQGILGYLYQKEFDNHKSDHLSAFMGRHVSHDGESWVIVKIEPQELNEQNERKILFVAVHYPTKPLDIS